MNVTVEVELTPNELAQLRAIEGREFLPADEIHAAVLRLIRRQLGPPAIMLGPLASLIYLHSDDAPGVGRRHVFHGRRRPDLVWDGHGLATRGGAFRVTETTGIVETARRSPKQP